MIHLVIDTSIFRQDPQRKTVAFRSIEQLGERGHLCIHIPYFVKHEFLSHLKEEFVDSVLTFQKCTKDLKRKVSMLGIKTTIRPSERQIEHLCKAIEGKIDQDFLKWTKKTKAKTLTISNHHGKRVANDYFSGNAPFSGRKSRKDMPDAFIFQSVRDLSRKFDHLHVVAADGGLSFLRDSGIEKTRGNKDGTLEA